MHQQDSEGTASSPLLSNGVSLSGPIPRVEPKSEQLELASRAETVRALMLDYDHARRLTQRGVDLDAIDADIILSSTISDDELEEWFPAREVALARRTDADAVIPCDRPVYGNDPKKRRVETVQSYVNDLLELAPRFRDAGTAVVPLVKGESEYERGLCYDAFDKLGCSAIAYYCVQYFTYGFQYSQLLKRLQRIALEFDPEKLMLIGLQSENMLPDLPPCVSSAAGQRWLRNSNPRYKSLETALQEYETWSRRVRSALRVGQKPLQAYSEAEVCV